MTTTKPLRETMELGPRFSRQAEPYYLAALLAKLEPAERPMFAAVDAAALKSWAGTYHRVKMAQCNREISAREQRQADMALHKAELLASHYGLKVEASGSGLSLVLTGDALAPYTSGSSVAL